MRLTLEQQEVILRLIEGAVFKGSILEDMHRFKKEVETAEIEAVQAYPRALRPLGGGKRAKRVV